MKRLSAFLFGLALIAAAADARTADEDSRRSGYSYLRDTTGDVSIVSRYNGRVDARRNLPISAGDEIDVADNGRAEVALADGNVLFVGAGTQARFSSLRDQQGEEDQFSAINLLDGSVVLAAFGDNESQIPRVDTEDATIYLSPGARVRVNADSRRGTVVVGRGGNAEVRTRAGTFRLRAGEFLEARGDEEPQTERGAFSRDRFDIWVADRMDNLTDSETRSASSQYVGEDHASDVAALDGYGDWQYNDEYGSDVWSPRVEADWTPYGSGSWYYTPAGMTWWSSDPWGWYPFHYGSWFFSSSWNRWCWRPASVYSPGWVYWAYTPSYIGWCPFGWYSFWSPWYDNYYRHLGWFHGRNVTISINGVFSPRSVDFRGWNFAGSRGFGTAVARMDVIPGSRIADRLGSASIAVSSRPMVVNARPGQAREAVQSFVREAPRVIERTASASDSARFAPILGRQRILPAATLEAVQQHAVVTERGRLAGPGVAEVAPRGVLVDRNRSLTEIAREPAAALRGERNASGRSAPGRSIAPRDQAQRLPVAPPAANARTDDWRTRSLDARGRESLPQESWRARRDVPPARRVIEGAVPGRRVPEGAADQPPRPRASRSSEREFAPPAREFRPAPRPEFRAPQPPPPPRVERAPAAPPRVERAPAPPPPRAEAHSAPPADRGRRDH